MIESSTNYVCVWWEKRETIFLFFFFVCFNAICIQVLVILVSQKIRRLDKANLWFTALYLSYKGGIYYFLLLFLIFYSVAKLCIKKFCFNIQTR